MPSYQILWFYTHPDELYEDYRRITDVTIRLGIMDEKRMEFGMIFPKNIKHAREEKHHDFAGTDQGHFEFSDSGSHR